MTRRFKKAKLHDRNGELSKRWFVDFYYFNDEKQAFKREFVYIPMSINSKTERRRKGEEIVRSLNARLESGWTPLLKESLGIITLNDGLNHYLNIIKRTLRERTYNTYLSATNRLRDYLSSIKRENLGIEEFNYHHADRFVDFILNDNISNRTHNNLIKICRTIFNRFIEKDIITVNPFKKIKLLVQDKPPLDAYRNEETEIITKYLKNFNRELFIISLLVYYCFIRPQEIIRLKVENFDIDKKLIFISSNQSKTHKNSAVAMPDQLVTELIELGIKKMRKGDILFSSGLKPGTTQIKTQRIYEKWREFTKPYGIEKGIYKLKHTGAGRAIEAGMNVRDLQLQLRHASLDETQIYVERFKNVPGTEFLNKMPDL